VPDLVDAPSRGVDEEAVGGHVRAAGHEAQGRSSFWRHWPLLPILALAAALRLWGLGSQPVLFFDSGVYLGEGTFLASVAERAAAALVSPAPGGPLARIVQATEHGTDGHPPDIAKPGHAVLLGLAMLVFGKTVLAGGLVSGLAGVGTIALTYALGVLGWSRWVALPAALVLAVSGQHLVYSREPLVEADGLFFATAAGLVYVCARRPRDLLLSGLLFGISFTCNNRVAYVPLVLATAELPRILGRDWRGLLRTALPLGVGFAVPPFVFELGYLALRGVARLAGASPTWLDYGQQLAAFSRMNPPDRIRLDQWPTYFVDVALMDGPLVLALFVAGTLLVLGRGRSRADLLLLGSVLVPLAVYSVYSTGEVRMRHFSLALPWVALAAGVGIGRIAEAVRRPMLVSTALALGLVLLGLPRAVSLASAPSGMPGLVGALGGRPVASTNGPVLSFFVGEDHTNARLRPAFVGMPADLRELASGYELMAVDMQAYVFPGELTDRYERAPPLLSLPNGNDAWYLADLLEHHGVAWGGWAGLLADWSAHAEAASRLHLYRMADLVGP
jgi:4-amino-4-deoxy-L-arabinose transferase-like glycosyltransferase